MPEPRQKLEALYDDWSRGDYSRGDVFDPEMTMETFGMGEPIRADSYDGFVDVMRKWLSAWGRPLTIEAEEFIQAGDRILVLIHWAGKGKESGAQIEGSGAHLWTFRDGLVVRDAGQDMRDTLTRRVAPSMAMGEERLTRWFADAVPDHA